MLTITTTDGKELHANTELLLTSKLAAHELGQGWDEGISPFDAHTTFLEYLEFILEFSDRTT